MLAAVYDERGPALEVLHIVELDDPAPQPGEVRVRVRVSGVNPSDWRARRFGNGLPITGQQIPHSDGAGRIDLVGEGISAELLGQRVWVWNAAWMRPNGTAAQYVCVPVRQAVPISDDVSDSQAAGLGIPYMTAWHCLFASGPLCRQTVLVAGGAGAVGNAAVQLASAAGARVIATVSSPEKAALAKAAGADVVVDYRDSRAENLIRASAPDGVDRIIEVAPTANLELDLAVTADGASIVVYAPEAADPTIPVQRALRQNLRMEFVLVYTIKESEKDRAVAGISAVLNAGLRSPLPTARFSLPDIGHAHVAVENHTLGKILVDIPE